jgi:hypothetical protein
MNRHPSDFAASEPVRAATRAVCNGGRLFKAKRYDLFLSSYELFDQRQLQPVYL